MKRSKCRSRTRSRSRTKRDENRSRWRRPVSGKRVRWVQMIGRGVSCDPYDTDRVPVFSFPKLAAVIASIEVNPSS